MHCIQGSESPLMVTHNRREIRVNSNKSGKDVDFGVVVDPQQNCPTNSAVYIRNLCKTYGSGPPVLQNLCMNVRKGTIYGLLGSSGCGKTTILSCLVGLQEWDSGEILVFGKKPGTKGSGIPGKRLGYMPQDLALYGQLSILEMIQFYGRIYNMNDEEVTEKWVFLSGLLDLPANFKLIADLSGGQKRRASLCLSLMQSPELMVLDEPTVGLDPLLRRSIWNHLYKIVSTLNTTIIITTHYIEEARLANTIGFVRKGRLLVEDTPTRLLHQFNCSLLEEVVLNLCRKDESGLKALSNNSNYEQGNQVTFKSNWGKDSDSVARHNELMDGIFRKTVGFDVELSEGLRRKEEDLSKSSGSLLSRLRHHPIYETFQRIRGLTTVILLTFMRHPVFIFLILLLPTIHGSITLGTIGTKPRGLALSVVNHELSNWKTECETPKHLGNSCDFSSLSCKYLNQIGQGDFFKLVSAESEAEARQLVHLGQSWGYLSFPENYSQHFVDLMAARGYAFNESIEGSRIHASLDYSQYIASFFMIKELFGAYGHYLEELITSCQLGGNEAAMPLNFRKPVYGHNEDNYTEFLMPGVILICLLCILSVLTSVIFIQDLKQGTLSRARVAGLATFDVMISHMLTQGLVALAQIVLWTVILHICYGFTVLGSGWLYLVICLLAGLCGAAIGILLGILCGDEVVVMIFAVFWCPILLLFGGIFWPLEAMSRGWQYVGMVLPTTLPIVSLRSVIVRGVGLSHPLVWPGVVVLCGWTVIFSILVLIAYKRLAK